MKWFFFFYRKKGMDVNEHEGLSNITLRHNLNTDSPSVARGLQYFSTQES